MQTNEITTASDEFMKVFNALEWRRTRRF